MFTDVDSLKHYDIREPYGDEVALNTIGDVRKFINSIPTNMDDLPAKLFCMDTTYDMDGDVRVQDCIEHSGKRWTFTGLIFTHRG
jgi:hypothetical protein